MSSSLVVKDLTLSDSLLLIGSISIECARETLSSNSLVASSSLEAGESMDLEHAAMAVRTVYAKD